MDNESVIMTLTIVCEKGHESVYKNIVSVPAAAIRGFKDHKDKWAQWTCQNKNGLDDVCGAPCMKDPVTGQYVAKATGGVENEND